nr:ribonuclease H-like domain-containing protein [Tanacetum cinerariifolium]
MVTRAQVGTVKPNPRFHGHASPISPLPKSPSVALSNPNWRNAMYDEYNALIKNGTWVLVPKPPNANVPQGFVDARFPHHVCRLQRSLYGLKQAPRAWFQRFAGYANRVGFSWLLISCKDLILCWKKSMRELAAQNFKNSIWKLLRSGGYLQRSLRIGKGMFGNKGLSTYGVKVDMFRYAVLVGRLSSHTFVSRERWDYIRIDYVSINCHGSLFCSDHAFFTFQSPIHYYDDEAAVLDLREKSKDRICSQWSSNHTMEEWH